MDTKQWTTVDKSGWNRGPWDNEPDKMQWTDAATGMPCLIHRNGSGALCPGSSYRMFDGEAENYRDVAFVQSECTSLAQQLVEA